MSEVASPGPGRSSFLAHVSSHRDPAQLSQCLGQLQSLLARENLRPQPPDWGGHPNRNIWMACWPGISPRRSRIWAGKESTSDLGCQPGGRFRPGCYLLSRRNSSIASRIASCRLQFFLSIHRLIRASFPFLEVVMKTLLNSNSSANRPLGLLVRRINPLGLLMRKARINPLGLPHFPMEKRQDQRGPRAECRCQ